jgi:uncharacterized protein (TIGR04255 family)
MTEVHYNRAPILEAVIDIQVRFNPQSDPAAFLSTAQQMAQRVAARFPQSLVLPLVNFGIGMVPPVPGTAAAPMPQLVPRITHQGGLRLATAQNERVLLLQQRGLSFSHMPPYTRWKNFRDEAVELWRLFVSLTKPEAVTRTALRYINRFEIPHDIFELSDYFLFRPEVPERNIPQMVSSFFMQCQMPQPDVGPDVTATINLASAGRSPGSAQIILDFDVFAMGELSADSDAVIELLDRLRKRKNELFESCITDQARELIK